METFSASSVTGEFPAQNQWHGGLMFSFICAWINGWVNNREAGDLRHHRAHYDVIVMTSVGRLHHIYVPSQDHFVLTLCVLNSVRKQKIYGNIHVYHNSTLKWYKNTKFFPLEYKNIVNNMATDDLAMRSHSFGVHGIGKVRPECSGLRHGRFNSLGPSGTIWRRISGLTLALVMFFTDRTKPSPLPMLAIRVIPWQSLENNFTANAKAV